MNAGGPEPIKVELTVGLDTIVGQEYIGGGEDGPEYGPVTLAVAITEQAAAALLKSTDDREELRRIVRAQAIAKVSERLDPLIEEALEQALPTLAGAGVTLHEYVVSVARKTLERRDNSSFGARGETLLEKMIREEVKRTFKSELAGALTEAKEQVAAAVKEQGAIVLQETIERLARGR